jgi:sugar phosphate permease
VPALWLLIMALITYASVRPGPHAVQVHAPPWDAAEARALLRDPMLYSYGACYFCIKLIRYSLLFWLPYYLHHAEALDEITSGYVSTGFEVGGVFGTIALGYLSDRASRSRAGAAALALCGLVLALVFYARLSGASAGMHFAALALLGALLFGPDALVSGAAAQDLGGARGAATAVGMVNGLGSVGAFLQGIVTVSVQRAFGWQALLYVFVALSIVSIACLLPAMRLEARRVGAAR